MSSQNNGSRRDPECERRWRERVAAWESSGLPARAFCEQEGLVPHTLYSWRRELRKRDAEKVGRRTRSGESKPARFVAVDVTPAVTDVAIEIVLPDSTRVRVHGDAAVSTITNALRALRETAAC